MPVVNVRVTEDGFHVSREMAHELGFEPGEEAQVEIRRAPDREAIRQLALRYAWRRLGDAVGVDEPNWNGESWIVPLKVKGHAVTVGSLYINAAGSVLADRSATKEQLLGKLDASHPIPPAT